MIYKPVKKVDDIINCFFSKKLNVGSKIKHCSLWQSYFCSNYYTRKDKFDRHFENCTGQPGYVSNFNTQNLLTLEENLKYKGDIPLATYIDFETTAPTDKCLEPKNRKTFVVSYVIIFAFHPDLNIDCVIIERSFAHSREKLTSLSYLTCEQLNFKDNKALLQLRDRALVVAGKKDKIAISEMLSTELKFAADCLPKWFNKRFKSDNLELSNGMKKSRKLNIQFIGNKILVVFVLFLLRTDQHCSISMKN